MGVQVHFNNFSGGELTPLLNARVDYEKYNKGGRTLENVLVLAQGGITKRFGTKVELPDLFAETPDVIKIELLEFNEDKIFILVFTNNALRIYDGNVLKKQFGIPFPASEVKSISVAQNFNDMIIQQENHAPYVLSPNADSSDWTLTQKSFKNSPTYDFERDYDNISFKVSKVSGTNITITSSAGFWVARHVGGIFAGNEGTARITKWNSTTEVEADVIVNFKDTDFVAGKNCYIAEPVFSDTRGYGKTVTFYQGRLVFGGSRSLPYGVFMSDTFDVFNFDDTGVTPSNAITVLLSSENADIVKNIIVERNLFVFTNKGAFSTPPFTDKPASPADTYFIQQDKHGISDANPVILDNHVLYIDNGGKIVRELIYSVQESAYRSPNISVLSPQVIKSPVSAATFENPILSDSTYMILVNGDGTLGLLQHLNDENITAWTPCSGQKGNFVEVKSKNNQVYFLKNEGTTFWVEKIDFSVNTDMSYEFTFGSPQSLISGLGPLNGETIQIIGDGFVLEDRVVSGGQVQLEKAVTHFKCGLKIECTIIPMPAQYMTQQGNNLYKKKRIKTIYLNYYESLGIKINGKVIPDLEFSKAEFGESLTYKTGIYEYTNMGGWQRQEEIVITHDSPLDFTILGLTYGVEQ